MSSETERKFLVAGDYKEDAQRNHHIIQGFLSTDPERTVRVRLFDETGFITVKGIGNASGTTRFEWEKRISNEDAKALLGLCKPHIIEKKRYIIPVDSGHIVEVDEFSGVNEGLVLAEIELNDENEVFEKPGWLGREVTGEAAYYNSMLSKKPFCDW